mmetsp:Transcript_36183/g.77163  ORF Transcript_36183/g.77163 Transcript_36183/m.77163 type:complete len:102 (-) Transcript_36183:331-636(-)
MFADRETKQSVDDKRTPAKKRKATNRGSGKAAGKSPPVGKNSGGGVRGTSPSGARGGRPRWPDDVPVFDVDEHNKRGTRDHIVDKRFFDGFIDDFDMSDMS